MDREEWKKRYCEELVRRAGVAYQTAEDNFNACDEWDFDYPPEMAASDELSYWAQDMEIS